MFPRGGFTLLELMTVVVVIGLLAAIAIPRFADLLGKSKSGAAKGNLGALRGALKVYYGDMEGQYPVALSSLTTSSKYLAAIPKGQVEPYHPLSASINEGPSPATDAGGWAYVNTDGDANFGSVWINCTHTDSKGSRWTEY